MGSLLEPNFFFCLITAGNNDCEEQAPGGHARPFLGVHKLGNNRVDFRVQFVGVFQFKLKWGESNRHFASLRLCSPVHSLTVTVRIFAGVKGFEQNYLFFSSFHTFQKK